MINVIDASPARLVSRHPEDIFLLRHCKAIRPSFFRLWMISGLFNSLKLLVVERSSAMIIKPVYVFHVGFSHYALL